MTSSESNHQVGCHDGNAAPVLVVLGTRPEAIKLAPVVRSFRECGVEMRVCVTGQHREMLAPILSFFEIVPDYDLSVMSPGQSLSQLTGAILNCMAGVIAKVQPAVVVVQGDTTTAFAASLAAYYEKVPVAHVEAGLRTGLKYAPFPEEVNRQLAAVLADFHFAPTPAARENLLGEGIEARSIWVTGNTAIDALLYTHGVIQRELPIHGNSLAHAGGPVVNGRPLVLITAHRRENHGSGLENICHAILSLARMHVDVDFLFPVHMNPRVRGPVESILGQAVSSGLENLFLTEPLDYPSFVYAMGRSRLILTDSGGIQEEAPSLGKRVLVMREATERPEGVAVGAARLVGTEPGCIIDAVTSELASTAAQRLPANPYGDGQASERITQTLQGELSLATRR